MRLDGKKRGNPFSFLILLFPLVFAAIGIFMFGMMLYTICMSVYMANWEVVPARLSNVQLERSTSSNSVTKEVIASYSYLYNGREYQGSRVSLYGKDNIGSFHDDTFSKLDSSWKQKRTVDCYVNPSNPSESILFPVLRWGRLALYCVFALVFGGFGVIIFYFMFKSFGKGKTVSLEKPWLADSDMKGNSIVSSNKKRMFLAVGMAVFWNLISYTVAGFVLREALSKGDYKALFVLIFPVVGLGIIIWAVYEYLRWRKFGDSVFVMSSVPGVIGGKLGGVVNTRVNIFPEDGFDITLTCVRRTVSGSGKHQSVRETVLWQDKLKLKRELLYRDYSRSSIPVLFAIPYDSRETCNETPSDRILWKLELRAELPGTDYYAEFLVPVYKTPESDPDFVLDDSSIRELVSDIESTVSYEDYGIIVTPLGKRSKSFYCPPARNRSIAAGMTFFFIIWTAVVVFLFMKAPLLFAVIFCVVDFIVFYIVLRMWFYSSKADIFENSLLLSSGIMFKKTREFMSGEIKSIKPYIGMQQGSKIFYDVKMETRDGAKYTIAPSIPEKEIAEKIASDILEILE